MGAADVEHDRNGLVWATVPANTRCPLVLAFNAHLDTSPETSGKNVRPQVIERYSGGDISLPGDPTQIIRAADNPELEKFRGKTIITTDGTTLLGADDKAGVAVIMEFAQTLLENSALPHGLLRLLFTCDEEIGHGTDHVDLKKLAADICYTLDGSGADEIDVETFSADLATVTFRGVNIHPSIAKDKMINAVRAAGAFLELLPKQHSPEQTEGRSGFLHPYVINGGVAQAELKILIRDFETEGLMQRHSQLAAIAADVRTAFPGIDVTLVVTPQYRNLREALAVEPRAVHFAEEAHRRLGRVVKRTSVRGGTDGSQLSARGLPTPNLSTGQHNLHSKLEWASLDEMLRACEVLLELVRISTETQD